MSIIQKIRLAQWAMNQRLSGYRLLKNPKGTSPLEINMIRIASESYNSHNGQHNVVYDRIKATIDESDRLVEEEKNLFVDRVFDSQTKCFSKRKNRSLYTEQRTGAVLIKAKYKEKNDYKHKEWIQLPEISQGDAMLLGEIVEKHKQNPYYKMCYSLMTKIISFGLYKKIGPPSQQDRPNFFKVLYNNLTNK